MPAEVGIYKRRRRCGDYAHVFSKEVLASRQQRFKEEDADARDDDGRFLLRA